MTSFVRAKDPFAYATSMLKVGHYALYGKYVVVLCVHS